MSSVLSYGSIAFIWRNVFFWIRWSSILVEVLVISLFFCGVPACVCIVPLGVSLCPGLVTLDYTHYLFLFMFSAVFWWYLLFIFLIRVRDCFLLLLFVLCCLVCCCLFCCSFCVFVFVFSLFFGGFFCTSMANRKTGNFVQKYFL